MQPENPAMVESCSKRAVRVCGKMQEPLSKRDNGHAQICEYISERHKNFI